MRDRHFAVALLRDAGGNALCDESAAEPVGVVAASTEHRRGGRQGIEHQRCTLVIAHLPPGD